MKPTKADATSIPKAKSLSQTRSALGKQKTYTKTHTYSIDTPMLLFGAVLIIALIALFRRHHSGRRMNENGYVIVTSTAGLDRLEHRAVAEEILGRRLEDWEVVHHINGRRADNRPTNLCVMHYNDHDRYHEWYIWIYRTYGNYPRRETQLRKLREDFNGTLLIDVLNSTDRTA